MNWQVIHADVCDGLGRLADGRVQCVVTSPPYWAMRDYGVAGQIGMEPTSEAYIERMVAVFREVRRMLRPDGTLWLNMGDSYIGGGKGGGGSYERDANWTPSAGTPQTRPTATLKPKDLVGIPWRLALALQADGWWLRQDIIWHKPNPMPESVRDRCTKAHEYLFLLAKGPRYYFDAEAIKEEAIHAGECIKNSGGKNAKMGTYGQTRGGFLRDEGVTVGSSRNKRSVWTIATQPYPEAHFATFPEKLVEPCIRAGTSAKGCCPACGAPWRRVVERHRQRTRPGATTKVPGKNSRMFQTHDPAHEAEAYKVERYELVAGNRDAGRHVTTTRTTGWEPTCECTQQEPVPCMVLDPFCGSGTVGAVAIREGRGFVGIELNPEYVALAEKRIADAAKQPKLFYG